MLLAERRALGDCLPSIGRLAMLLRDRCFKPNAATMLIEHRSSGRPTVPTFLRVTEHERFTEYELTRSLRGKQLLHIYVARPGVVPC